METTKTHSPSEYSCLGRNSQRMVNIDPLDFTILLNNNVVDYNDLVVNAHVNYLSVIHAVRRDVNFPFSPNLQFSYVITKPLEQSMIYLHCQHCHQFNPHYVIRPICSDCQYDFTRRFLSFQTGLCCVPRPALSTGAHARPIVLPAAREMPVFHVSKVQEGAMSLSGVYL